MTIGVGARQRGSLASMECGYGPDGVSGLRLGADCVDVLKHMGQGMGVDNALFHGNKFVGGTTKFLLGKSETAKCSGMVVKEGAVADDFCGYARVA
jgi:hypothetical protein